jgi:oxalate decarboxylase/phosphoglucose isomerase-like protein (cupin superfamily)
MFSSFLLFTALLPFTTAQYPTPPNSHTKDPTLVAKLKAAATYYDRQLLLKEDTDWYYNVSKHEHFNKPGGAVITVDVSQMAALEGAGVSIAVLKMGPCGMLPVHEHPRAGNVVTGITGNVTSWMIGDNGSRVVTVNIRPFIVTFFPQGTVHVMQNNGTSPLPLFLALSHPTPTL